MISRAPPTPPMPETRVPGIASSVLEISDLAAKVSVRLFALSRKVRDAMKPIEALSKDIASTGAVLNQLGHRLKKGEDLKVGSSTLVTSVDDLVEECSNMFESIDKALDGNNTGSKAILGLQHYVHVASLEPQLVVLETNLERLKTPLALMLNVLIYAEQLKSEEKSPLLKEQQELIRVLNEERKDNERRFHKLTTESRSRPEGIGAPEAPRIEPILTQYTLYEGLPNQERPSQETREEKSKAKGRVWIRDESPEREDRPIIDGPPLRLKTSLIDRVSSKVRGRVRIPDQVPDEQQEEEDDSSLLDMASFLKSTGPDTPRTSSGEDPFTFSPPAKLKKPRPKYQARDPIARSDTSDLIDFFREGSPRVKRKASNKKLPVITLVRGKTEPMTPPLTAHEDTEKRSPLPPHISSMQSRVRSQSDGLPSPLGSHPPATKVNISRPATTKWPLQAVLAWLEKNSFSAEWQDTFRILEIEGSEFVELESGQSIRKMLTVIYPQLAKECSESGRGWDQARERAEGQRLRKLIRELPVDIKYEDAPPKVPEKESDRGPATAQSPSKSEMASGGRPRPVTAPAEATSPASATPFRSPRNEFARTDIFPLPESVQQEDQEFSLETPQSFATKINDQPRLRVEVDTSNVSDEWVRKWTVLSAEEIARGRREDVRPFLMD
ncbi:hypothetical protein GJ744_004975 [Endocarpon pusillum]|uniref:SAM domain-containing protein n=1 Tax=Endocarpon pusillum TaxID=364733 RepID=A0A8H7DXD1_9EURO|nr:hypothetical protein GJ744_004975 [Endocarpon pusillum]